MKKIFVCVLLIIPAAIFSQSTPRDLPDINTDYLKKSKNQKTAALVLVCGGLGLTTTGLVLGTAHVSEDVAYTLGGFLSGEPPPENDYTAEAILLVTGTAAMLGSIPLFIASGKNRKKAWNMSTNLRIEKTMLIERQSFVQSSYPAIALKINL